MRIPPLIKIALLAATAFGLKKVYDKYQETSIDEILADIQSNIAKRNMKAQKNATTTPRMRTENNLRP